MALSLQKFREIVFQLLYSRCFEESEQEVVSLVMRQNAIPKKTVRIAWEKVEEIWRLHEDLDQKIRENSPSYDLERIPFIERSVLRLGLYELLHTDLPPKVAISEALRLTHKYATAEGAKFVNALLDQFYKEKKEHALEHSNPQTS